MRDWRHIVPCVLVAFVLWTIMFSPWTCTWLPFWWAMSGAAVILITLSLVLGGRPPFPTSYRWGDALLDVALGIAIAAVLWGCFWIGDKVSQWIFPFARPQVNLIYGMKEGWNLYLLSTLLLLLIGPAEELFWRGFIQRRLGNTWQAALITLAVYTGVHLFSFNLMLILAAMVCGVVWGGLYYLMPKRFGALLISHALWDAAVFIWWPI